MRMEYLVRSIRTYRPGRARRFAYLAAAKAHAEERYVREVGLQLGFDTNWPAIGIFEPCGKCGRLRLYHAYDVVGWHKTCGNCPCADVGTYHENCDACADELARGYGSARCGGGA